MKTLHIGLGLFLVACGSSAAPQSDAAARGDAPVRIDSRPGEPDGSTASVLPSWMLPDVNPASPGSGQTYGLATFADKVIVATLLEGF